MQSADDSTVLISFDEVQYPRHLRHYLDLLLKNRIPMLKVVQDTNHGRLFHEALCAELDRLLKRIVRSNEAVSVLEHWDERTGISLFSIICGMVH